MKYIKILPFFLFIIVLTVSSLALEPQGFSPSEAENADDVYYFDVEELTPLEKFLLELQNTFAIAPAEIPGDEGALGISFPEGEKVKFATDAQLKNNCDRGYLIFEIYRDTNSDGSGGGDPYKIIKDDGHSNLKKDKSASAYFSFTLPDGSAGEYWAVVVYFTCGDTINSDAHDYIFYVTSSDGCNVGEVIGRECFDEKVFEYYLDSSCVQKTKAVDDCGGFLESCQNGKCVEEDAGCSDYNGHICSNDEVCNGVELDVQEDNCCSVTCADVVECYASSDCDSGEYCNNNVCDKVITSEEEVTESDYVCCYMNDEQTIVQWVLGKECYGGFLGLTAGDRAFSSKCESLTKGTDEAYNIETEDKGTFDKDDTESNGEFTKTPSQVGITLDEAGRITGEQALDSVCIEDNECVTGLCYSFNYLEEQKDFDTAGVYSELEKLDESEITNWLAGTLTEFEIIDSLEDFLGKFQDKEGGLCIIEDEEEFDINSFFKDNLGLIILLGGGLLLVAFLFKK